MNKFFILISLALLTSQQTRCCHTLEFLAEHAERVTTSKDLSIWLIALTISKKSLDDKGEWEDQDAMNEHWKKEKNRQKLCSALLADWRQEHPKESIPDASWSKSVLTSSGITRTLEQEVVYLNNKTLSGRTDTWDRIPEFDFTIQEYERQRARTLEQFSKSEQTLSQLQLLLQKEHYVG